MSLIRQVWLLLCSVLLIALAGGVSLSVLAARDALQTQARLKNDDNAQSLALALSQQHGDEARMQLLMQAQFDTGHYQRLVFRAPDNGVRFERVAPAGATRAPG